MDTLTNLYEYKLKIRNDILTVHAKLESGKFEKFFKNAKYALEFFYTESLFFLTLKTLPKNSYVLDFAAGSGATDKFPACKSPACKDLKIYGALDVNGILTCNFNSKKIKPYYTGI